MEAFWKTAAVVIIAVILSAVVGKSGKDFAVALILAACCAVLMAALQYLWDVIAFLWKLGNDVPYLDSVVSTLLRISAIALMTELTGLISADAGNTSLGKAMHILGNAAVLSLSLPLFETFFTMIQEILGIL